MNNFRLKMAKLETVALTLLGVATLPMLRLVAPRLDFGSDSAGDAMLAGAFVFLGAPIILFLITLRLIFLGRSFKDALANLLPFAYVLTWLGGILVLVVVSAIEPGGRVEYLSVSNRSAGAITELKVRGLHGEHYLPRVENTGDGAATGGFMGRLPVDLVLTWIDESGSNCEQFLHVSSPEPLPSSIKLYLTLSTERKWTDTFDKHR